VELPEGASSSSFEKSIDAALTHTSARMIIDLSMTETSTAVEGH
jgi:hypothetical protein